MISANDHPSSNHPPEIFILSRVIEFLAYQPISPCLIFSKLEWLTSAKKGHTPRVINPVGAGNAQHERAHRLEVD